LGFYSAAVLAPPAALDSIRGCAQHRLYTNKINGDETAAADHVHHGSLRFGLPGSLSGL
jgi:hypothetical protein